MGLEQKVYIGLVIWWVCNIIYISISEKNLNIKVLGYSLVTALMIPIVATLCIGVLLALVQVFFVAFTGERLILL